VKERTAGLGKESPLHTFMMMVAGMMSSLLTWYVLMLFCARDRFCSAIATAFPHEYAAATRYGIACA